jgi:hypothetical protein
MPKDKTLIASLALLAVLIVVLIGLTRIALPEQDTKERVANYATFEGISISNTSNPNTEYLTISLSPPDNQPVVVTGWNLAGTKYKLTLGNASPLPTQGVINDEVPIVISKQSTIIVSTGHSPIGVSFRENKCTGILGLYQTYTPPLTPSCSDCLDTSISSYPEYNLCVETHRSDPDFFLNTWRLYVGTDTELWRNSLEVLHLYDQDGKLIALKSL